MDNLLTGSSMGTYTYLNVSLNYRKISHFLNAFGAPPDSEKLIIIPFFLLLPLKYHRWTRALLSTTLNDERSRNILNTIFLGP